MLGVGTGTLKKKIIIMLAKYPRMLDKRKCVEIYKRLKKNIDSGTLLLLTYLVNRFLLMPISRGSGVGALGGGKWDSNRTVLVSFALSDSADMLFFVVIFKITLQ